MAANQSRGLLIKVLSSALMQSLGQSARSDSIGLWRGAKLFRVYGNTFTVKELQRSAILTIEPENIKTILSLKSRDYGISHRLELFKPLLGEGIFNTDGEHWVSSRALIRPSFVREQIANLSFLEELI